MCSTCLKEVLIWERLLIEEGNKNTPQHSSAQQVRSEVNSQGIKNIPLDDLRCAIVIIEEQDDELVAVARGSPFNWEIWEALLLEGFKLPNIKAYEGKADPHDHLDHFNDLMELHMVSDLAKCKVFIVTLSNGAKKWFRSLTPGSVTSWQQLSTSFMRQFQATKQFAVSLAHLGNVKQQEGESLKSFLNRFTMELSRVRWVLDIGVLAHLTNRFLPKTPFWDELQQKKCKSVSEFYKSMSKFLKLENSKEALHKTKESTTSKKNGQGEKMKGRKEARREEQMISEEIAQRSHAMGSLIIKHLY